MKNKITDLNNHLFAQLERLGDEDLKSEDLEKEIGRAKAITGVASAIVESTQVTLEAMKLMERAGHDISKMDGSKLLLGGGDANGKPK